MGTSVPRLKSAAVFAPFLLLAILFASTDLVAMRRVAKLRTAAELGMQTTLANNEALSQMERDLGRVQRLAERHILGDTVVDRETIDANVAWSRAEYAVAAAEYEATPMPRQERARWQQLKAEIADMWPGIQAVLESSGRSDEGAAQGRLATFEGDFSRLRDDFRSLHEINRRAVDDAVTHLALIQRTATVLLQLFGFAGMGLSVAVGLVTVRALRRRDDRLQENAGTLAASNRELDAFAGRVAHDLRNPLSTATLAASRSSALSPSPEQTKLTAILQRSFVRMAEIIEDLLAISRMQHAEPVSDCDPAAAAEQLREDLAPRVEGSDVSLFIDVQPAKVHCSEGLLRQVLWNLTDNAMKYRREQVPARVEICGRSIDDHSYELWVQDNGIGIPPEETGKVFDPFYRVAGRTGVPGTGLGLSIVKRAVEANGGTVSLTSEPGTGSKFVARLPLA